MDVPRPRIARLDSMFAIVVVACGLFFALTVVAMFLYPGGRVGDPQSTGYAFFTNFFSDLGQTRTYGGHANGPSLVLFCVALGATAFAMGLFFVGFSLFFAPASPARLTSTLGAVCGIVAGLSFLGVAATPWNVYLRAHNEFVLWAFRSFLAAVVLCAVAGFVAPNFPRRFAWVFVAFAVLLAVYVGVITLGPRPDTAAGAAIQATAQKIIVYASVLTVLVQALYARAWLKRAANAEGTRPQEAITATSL
jgi:hypothetical protein